jgi:hypothetical protein
MCSAAALLSAAFSFSPARELKTQTFQSVRPTELYSAETGPKRQREEFPLGAQAAACVPFYGADAEI